MEVLILLCPFGSNGSRVADLHGGNPSCRRSLSHPYATAHAVGHELQPLTDRQSAKTDAVNRRLISL
jgi:hypothetical protein